MKMLLYAAAAACIALPSASEGQSPQIVVRPQPLQEWVAAASRSLERQLMRMDVSQVEPGISAVRFNIGTKGKPVNVKTVERANSDLDRVARLAVRRARLEPMAGTNEKQTYKAIVVMGKDPVQLAQLRSRALARAAEENARWAGRRLPNPAITLGVIADIPNS